jgi:DNA-binding transcriptional LysR family regulator
MEFRELKSLIALHELGSIRDAAMRCNISPAALHKHLKTLESEFGTRIYEKQEGRLALTEPGRIVLPFAKEVLLHHDAAFTAVSEWRDRGCGVVRVGAGPSFSGNLLPPLVKRFRRKFPRVDVYVETGDSDHLISRLRSGSLDLVFDLSMAAVEHKDLQQVAQWEAQMGFISGRPEIPSHCRLRKLAKVPFILFRKGTLIETAVSHYLSSLDFQPSVVMRSDSSEAIKGMVRTGLGISVLFLWNLESDQRGSALRVIRTEAPPLSLRMGLIRVKSSYTSKAVNAFIQLAGGVNWKNLHLIGN